MFFLIPFEYEFFRHGFIAAVVIGALCGFIGVYVVLRRMSYIGHGLSHAIFGGAVLSYTININFFLGAGIWGLLAGFLIHRRSGRRWVGADAAIGVVTTSSFALGVAIVSTYRSFTRNIEAALFGNILGITTRDLWVIVAISLVIFCALLLMRRRDLVSDSLAFVRGNVARRPQVCPEAFDHFIAKVLQAQEITYQAAARGGDQMDLGSLR